jgi:hypothetical protein
MVCSRISRGSRFKDREAALRTTTFVQQLKRQNAPRAKDSLFLWEQGVAPFSGVVCARNSGTIRATPPLDRGAICPGAAPSEL